MKPEAQRIAIAEACGWKRIPWHGAYPGFSGWMKDGEFVPFEQTYRSLPDYPNDLNAMREAEKVLTYDQYSYKFGVSEYTSTQRADYYQLLMFGKQPCFLEDGCGKRSDRPPSPPNLPHLRGDVYATAAQRAEAFLRTLNLWKPSSHAS